VRNQKGEQLVMSLWATKTTEVKTYLVGRIWRQPIFKIKHYFYIYPSLKKVESRSTAGAIQRDRQTALTRHWLQKRSGSWN